MKVQNALQWWTTGTIGRAGSSSGDMGARVHPSPACIEGPWGDWHLLKPMAHFRCFRCKLTVLQPLSSVLVGWSTQMRQVAVLRQPVPEAGCRVQRQWGMMKIDFQSQLKAFFITPTLHLPKNSNTNLFKSANCQPRKRSRHRSVLLLVFIWRLCIFHLIFLLLRAAVPGANNSSNSKPAAWTNEGLNWAMQHPCKFVLLQLSPCYLPQQLYQVLTKRHHQQQQQQC